MHKHSQSCLANEISKPVGATMKGAKEVMMRNSAKSVLKAV